MIEPTLFDPMIGAADDQRCTETAGRCLSKLVNGDFETHALFPLRPDGWYDLRQGRIDGTTLSGHGQSCLTLTNAEPGKNAQALQAIAVDGRRIQSLQFSALVRCQNVQPGLASDQCPRMQVFYFDEKRALVGKSALGPWMGSFPWTRMSAQAPVPPEARTAIVAIGLLGATGEVSLDDVELTPAAINIVRGLGDVEVTR